jgi:hypothetical protein
VEGSGQARHLFISRGKLGYARSTLKTERLGALLIAEGRVEPAALERLASKARAGGVSLGHVLVAEQVLSPAELAAWLERQIVAVFRAALGSSQEGAVLPVAEFVPVGQRMLGALVVDAYRDGVVPRRTPTLSLPLAADQAALAEIGLRPAESRLVRQLASAQPLPPGTIAPELEAVVVAALELGFLKGPSPSG